MNDGIARHTRVFSAPRELVFQCMLTPEHLTQFWGPAGMLVCSMVTSVRPSPRSVKVETERSPLPTSVQPIRSGSRISSKTALIV